MYKPPMLILAVDAEPPTPSVPSQAIPSTEPPGPAAGEGAPRQSPFSGFGMMLILMMVVFFVFIMGGQRKEKKKKAKLLASLAKGDKVQTVGGILGTVIELRDSDIVLKVDENANTRIKFSRSAIQSVYSEKPDG